MQVGQWTKKLMKKKLIIFNLIFLITAVIFAQTPCRAAELYATAGVAEDNIPVYSYTVIHSYPHDNLAFTQGLVYNDGFLFEGTGLPGYSTLRKVNLETGKVIKMLPLDKEHFGEGITFFGNKIAQLTLDDNIGFIYDGASFKRLGKFNYPTAGWGITYDGINLIMSDGTEYLYFLDTNTFQKIKKITVTANGIPVKNINELEYINGKIYANIWMTDKIAIINPKSGKVSAWINLSGLLSEKYKKKIGHSLSDNGIYSRISEKDACLNGIAYDKKNNRLFVTGKLWPKVFEIRIEK